VRAGGGDLRCVETGSGLRDVGGGCEWYLGSEGETVAVFCFVVPRGAKSRGGMDGRLELAGCLYWPGSGALSTWTWVWVVGRDELVVIVPIDVLLFALALHEYR
jgi:hypothetical protein